MTKNENIIPKDVYKKLYLSAYLEIFFSEINLETFKDKTGNTILSGEIKNIGTQRGDFAKINVTFRKNWHGDVETLTAFAAGSNYTFKTGVASRHSILPGAIAEFKLVVPKSMGSFIGYSYTIDWEQYE